MGRLSGHPDRELMQLAQGELDWAGRRRVQAHLRTCAACQARAAELTELADQLHALPAALRSLAGRPARAWPSVWARVAAGGVPGLARPARQVRLSLSLASALCVLVAGLSAGARPWQAAVTSGVTAGLANTPYVLSETPLAGQTAAGDSHAAPGLAASATSAVRAVPAPTPMPGPRG